MEVSIYDSIEVEAWADGLSYENYLALRQVTGVVAAPLSQFGYTMLCTLMAGEMLVDSVETSDLTS